MRRFLLKRRTASGTDGAQASPSTELAHRSAYLVKAAAATLPAPNHKGNTLRSSPPPKDSLNPRQRAFVGHYVISKNATDAARKAGYSKKTANEIGSENLTKPNIRAEIDRLLGKQQERVAASADRVVDEMVKIAFSSMGNFVKVQADGTPYFDLSEMTPDQAASLDQITVEEFKDGRSDKREVRRIKVKLHDKPKALEMLAKHLGLFTEKHEHRHVHEHSLMGQMLKEIDDESRGKVIEHEPAKG